MPELATVLIVEDDRSIVLGLQSALVAEGYRADVARTGSEGLRLAVERRPDLIILDLMLPEMGGLEVCKQLREQKITTPVIMLTARADENDKVLGLELGADDYVTKPFGLRELLARVKSQLRREEIARPRKAVQAEEPRCFGQVTVNFKRHEVCRGGQLRELTHQEFRLLEYFIHNPGELLTRERLLDDVWGYGIGSSTRTVDNHILRLRKHIEPDPEHPSHIKTIRGAGYLFDPD